MNKVINKYLALGIILIVILSAVYLLINRPNKVSNQSQISTPTPIPTQEPEFPLDETNDGIYTNYKYGFSFEYPTDIFVYYAPAIPRESRIEAYFRDNDKGFPGELNMTVFASDKNDERESFEKYDKLPLNTYEYSDEHLSIINETVWPFNNRVKIKEIEIQNVEGYILYSKYIGHKRETESSHGHSVRLLKDEAVISINISSRTGENFIDDLKTKRLEILNSIINSLQFFIPHEINK